MLDLPSASNTTTSLRKLYDQLEIHLRSLDALGEKTDSGVIISIMTSKLPRATLVTLELKKGPTPWTCQDLRDALGVYIAAHEAADRLCPAKKPTDTSNFKASHATSPSPSPSSGHSLPAQAMSRRKPTCAFCKAAHYTDECTKVTTINDRQKAAKGRCLKCFSTRHSTRECTSTITCYHCKTSGHHRSLCPTKFTASSQTSLSAHAEVFTPHANTLTANSGSHVVMQTAVASCSTHDGDIVNARILFDTGANRTYVTSHLATRLNLPTVGKQYISLATFGNSKRHTTEYDQVEVRVQCNDGSMHLLKACVLPEITAPIQRVELAKRYPVLQSLPLAEPLASSSGSLPIDILVGLDHYYHIVGPDRLELPGGLVLLQSSLGFICTGTVPTPATSEGQSCLAVHSRSDGDPSMDLQRFWAAEEFPVPDNADHEDIVLQRFLHTLSFEDSRYVVEWPWRDLHDELPSNYGLALGRLTSLLKRVTSKRTLLQQYNSVLQDQLTKGIIEIVPPGPTSNSVHYLPHHCVEKPSHTTTKLRIVYDASAKLSRSHPSLNDCLAAGPNLVPDLAGVLLRFRLSPIAISSDIEKAFLQLSLCKADRDVTRFLWVKDLDQPPSPENLVVYRFCRVPFGVISSPFLLAATVRHHLSIADVPDAQELLRNIYVDNLFIGATSPDEALHKYTATKKLFSAASMNAREWSSNSPEFLHHVPELDCASTGTQKCLGMLWDTCQDSLYCTKVAATHAVIATKRHLLQTVAKFFDPLGLLSPVLVRAKILLQDVWKLDVGWDDPLPLEILDRWQSIAIDLEEAHTVAFPRYVSNASPNVSHALHVFCDASEAAYGVAAYLVTDNAHERASHLIYSKSRVAPVKPCSIPRLELMAALLGARVILYLRKELPLAFCSTVLWSDSTTVLHWLQSNDKLPVFVLNRVTAIRAVNDLQCRHVRSAHNPADLPSRGASTSFLLDNILWWHGPPLLTQPLADLPSNGPIVHATIALGEGPPDSQVPESQQPHNKKPDAHHKQKKRCDETPPFDIDVTRFSSFYTLVRVSGLCARFVSRLKSKLPGGAATGPLPLSSRETEQAQLLWIRHWQQRHYPDVVDCLASNKPHQLIGKLGLFSDEDGIIRCRGRLENADLCNDAKFPILLPRAVASLVITDCHKKVFHFGVNHTLASLRLKYWVPKGRAAVKSTLRLCQVCRHHSGPPFAKPNMAPLPSSRVKPSRAFSHTGIDFFGPVYVRGQPVATKVWVCLFSCMSTRAVHLETVSNMTTSEFLLAFRRFVARRGTPALIVSDNAPQFKAAATALEVAFRDILHHEDVRSHFARHDIQWQFIVESAPWMGGFYERLVGTVKKAMKKALGRSLVSLQHLSTLLTEIEAVVNSRPLVYIDEDVRTVLTPGHFLSISQSTGLFDLPETSDDPDFRPTPTTAEELLAGWKKGQNRLHEFWRMWCNDYLLSLRSTHTTHHSQGRSVLHRTPAIGEVVLIKDQLPRASWRLGKVCEVHVSADDKIRSASVTTADRRTLKRPLSLLYPLELSVTATPPAGVTADVASEPDAVTDSTKSRPQRAAAAKQRIALESLIEDDAV